MKSENPIYVAPITFRWLDWTTLHAELRQWVKEAKARSAPDLLALITTWQAKVDAWIATLSETNRNDAMELALSEIEMLWMVADPPHDHPPVSDWDRVDFRERFYVLSALVTQAEKTTWPKVAAARRALNELEARVSAMYQDWLP